MTRLAPDAFLGRARELAALDDALRAGARLVTVLGPPGMGKTRLARRFLELAGAREGAAPVRVFCDVAWATSEDDVVAALLRALSVDDVEEGTLAAVEALAATIELRGGALIVVDNFEPVARFAADTIGRLLACTKALTVIVTSRVRLRLEGELVLEVEPLQLPATDAAPLDVARSEAVRFLASRAQVDADKNASALCEIARRLDGVPLALELAAARLDVLSADELLSRLAAPLDVLTRGRRDAERRQASLRDAISASWSLLSDDEQCALARLSAFQGGFTMAAAEALIGSGALDAVQGLVEASLVTRRVQDDGRVRYGLYDSIRAFAEEKLREEGAHEEAHARHARFFLALVDEVHAAWQRARNSDVRALAERLAEEEVNVSVLIKRRAGTADALRAAAGLGVLSQAHGGALARLPLIRAALEDVVETAAPAVPAHVLGWARYWRAALSRAVGRGSDVVAFPSEGELFIDEIDDPALTCAFLHLRACFAIDGLLAASGFDAASDLSRVVDLAPRHGLRSANVWNLLANTLALQGDAAGARAAVDTALVRAHEEGDVVEQVTALATDAHLLALAGDFQAAANALSSATLLDDERIPQRVHVYLLWLRAEHLHAAGELSEAQRLASEVCDIARASGFTRYEAGALDRLALLHLERGHASKARALSSRAVELFEAAAPRWLARPLGTLAAALIAEGKLPEAQETLTRQARAHAKDLIDDDAITLLVPALLDVARARACLRAGELDEATRCHERARAALSSPLTAGAAVLRRLLERELATLAQAPAATDPWPADALVLDDEGAFYRPPGGARVDTSRRPVLRQVLRALALRHVQSGAASDDVTLDVPALFAAAWPGERAHPDAARARVRMAISTLRKEGLKSSIVTRDGAYALAPDVRVLLVGEAAGDEEPGS